MANELTEGVKYNIGIVNKTDYSKYKAPDNNFKNANVLVRETIIKKIEIRNEKNAIPKVTIDIINANLALCKTLKDIEITVQESGSDKVMKFNVGIFDFAYAEGTRYILFGKLCKFSDMTDQSSAYLGDDLKSALEQLDFKRLEGNLSTKITGRYWRINETKESAVVRLLKGIGNKVYYNIGNETITIIDPAKLGSSKKLIEDKRARFNTTNLYHNVDKGSVSDKDNLKKNYYIGGWEDTNSKWSFLTGKDRRIISRDNKMFAKNVIANEITSKAELGLMCSVSYSQHWDYNIGDTIEFPDNMAAAGFGKGIIYGISYEYTTDSYKETYHIAGDL